jgi:hypothetical protein
MNLELPKVVLVSNSPICFKKYSVSVSFEVLREQISKTAIVVEVSSSAKIYFILNLTVQFFLPEDLGLYKRG